MIENLERHRPQFEMLVAMITEDTGGTTLQKVALDYITFDLTRPAPINEARRQEYRALMTSLGLLSVARYDEKSIVMMAYAEGWSPEGGIYKGYEYFPNGFPLDRDVPVGDVLTFEPRKYEPGTTVYRKIDGHWYLWFLY